MTNNWQMLRIFTALAVLLCAALAYVAGPSWTGMLDAFLCGVNVGGVIYSTMQIKTMESIARMQAMIDEVWGLNHALIAGRVKMHIEGIDDEPPPTQPRMH